jgi:hypothetical protein
MPTGWVAQFPEAWPSPGQASSRGDAQVYGRAGAPPGRLRAVLEDRLTQGASR